MKTKERVENTEVGIHSLSMYICTRMRKRAHLYSVMVVQLMITGGTHIVAQAVVREVDPAAVLLLRTILSAAGMSAIFLLKGGSFSIERADVPTFVWLGILGIPINQYFYLYGMQYTTAANGALLYAATPTFVLLLSHFLLKEKITLRKSIGILLAFCGITMVIFEHGIDFSSEYTFGNILVLIAVVAWALFTISGRKMILKYGALHTTAVMMIFGTLSFFPFGMALSYNFNLSHLTLPHWSGIFYLSFGTSIAGYLIWYYALSHIETAKVAVFANGQPIVATLLSVFFLDYSITWTFVTGGILTIIGVVVTQLG